MSRTLLLSSLLLLFVSCESIVLEKIGKETEKKAFVSTWQTTTDGESVTLPLRSGFNYDFTVDWGDGTSAQVTAFDDTDITHSYATSGTYTVTIKGLAEAWYFNETGSKDNLISVSEFGDLGWINLERAFRGCANLTSFRGGDVSKVTSFESTFARTSALNDLQIGDWNTSSATTMKAMFYQAPLLNPDVSKWNTSNVTDMSGMFYAASVANPDVSSWNTSSVTLMNHMFIEAAAANPDVSNWDVSNVETMQSMFATTSIANPDVSRWNVSKVASFKSMFHDATGANPDVSLWNTSAVTDIYAMFYQATSANPDVSNWNVSLVTDMRHLFNGATASNPDVSNWDFSAVTQLNYIFDNLTLSTTNYSNFLIRVESTSAQSGLTIHAGSSKFNSGAAAARTSLLGRGWGITDGGAE